MDPAPPVEAAQPDATAPAQGPDDHLAGLYDLSTAPEELRPHLAAELKKINDGVSQRFREHADYRKQWEPLENIDGLRDVPQEELSELLQFREIASDPTKLEDWWSRLGEEMGWFDGDGPDGGEGGEGGDERVPAWAQQLTERLDGLEQTVKPLHEHVSTQEQQRRTDEHKQKIDAQLDAFEEQHGEYDRDAVLELAAHYLQQDDPNAVQRGFERYMQITGKAQGDLVDRKVNGQPAPTLTGGRPDTTPQKITSFKDAKEAALARLG